MKFLDARLQKCMTPDILPDYLKETVIWLDGISTKAQEREAWRRLDKALLRCHGLHFDIEKKLGASTTYITRVIFGVASGEVVVVDTEDRAATCP